MIPLQYTFFRLPSGLWQATAGLRHEVFVREQGVPEELELDEDDADAHHLLVQDDGNAVGTLRILLKEGYAKIGRVAVARSHRHRGTGTEMMLRAMEHCRGLKLPSVALDAQVPVVPFYERLDFRVQGEEFMDAGIPHRAMTLTL